MNTRALEPMQSFIIPLEPLGPDDTVDEVSELLLQSRYERFLCLPIVDQNKPIGSISRSTLQKIYMRQFGRELYGKKSVTHVMNPEPLVVGVEYPIVEASQYITRHLRFPISEDFIMTRNGQYCGIGHVVDLLKAMDQQLADRNREVAAAYRRLKSSQAQLVQSEKMASLGQMVAGVAHEINTPLGYVKNNITLAQDMLQRMQTLLVAHESLLELLTGDEAADEAMIHHQLATVTELRSHFYDSYQLEEIEPLFEDTLYGIEQISEIVVNLKNFSRLDQAAVDNVNLNQCIDSALLIAKNVLKHKVEIIKDYGTLPPISCSPSQLNQVFLNLLTNAAQAIAERGKITIKTYADAQYVYASIRDTGKGIAKDSLKKIFDPFFTTKPIGEGTGLGLSIVYKIIQDHQGSIGVASEVGVGTRFVIRLPQQKTPSR